MLTVGVCGPSGSGKSTFCAYLRDLGCKVIDCDAVYAKLIEPPSVLLDKLADTFGKRVIRGDGPLDRKALSRIVFGDPEMLRLLNETTFTHIIRRVNKILNLFRNRGFGITVIDAPLLFESGLDGICDLTVAVVSSRKSSVERISARDSIEASAAQKRLDNQKRSDELEKLCDRVIVNDRDMTRLRKKALELFDSLTETI